METIDNQEIEMQKSDSQAIQQEGQDKAYLQSIANWLLLFSVCSLVVCIIYLSAGVFLMIDRPFFNPTRIFISFFLKHNILYGLIIMALGVLFLIPTYRLFKTGRLLRTYLKSGISNHYSLALKEFKTFCRFCGIATIVFLIGSIIYYWVA